MDAFLPSVGILLIPKLCVNLGRAGRYPVEEMLQADIDCQRTQMQASREPGTRAGSMGERDGVWRPHWASV